jgi:hypothetical protein
MRKSFVFTLLFLVSFFISAQNGFELESGVDRVSIPFKMINNLIFIPLTVNGVVLTFMVDTGVKETILFSLDDKEEMNFKNVEKITLRGLGSEESIEGLKSTNNVIEAKGMVASNELLYVILDQSFNLSSEIGIPVNGIIGYQFFKNNLVEINYSKKRISIVKENRKFRNKLEKKFREIAITIEKSKPYVETKVTIENTTINAKLLIDIGNSDAFWLFQNANTAIKVPSKNFDDFLGKGFSGEIEGKRARVSKVYFDSFEFNSPVVAFPDSSSTKNVIMVKDRAGSVGAEVVKRFLSVFDYTNRRIFLKKTRDFEIPFSYNKSGIEVRHFGLQWVQETVRLETVQIKGVDVEYSKNFPNDFKYKFNLKPVYEIASVRKKSPADLCGLKKGDIIVSVNKIPGFKFSLEKINSLFKSEEDTWITLEVERESQILKFVFKLESSL